MNLRANWPWLKRLLVTAFLLVVAFLLYRQGREIEWKTVLQAARGFPWRILLGGLALTACSYVLYASLDVIGRRYVGHKLPIWAVMRIALISYAFNLNLGALIGGAGFRFRLYTQRGLDGGDVSRVLAMSVVGNWSGYALLLGLVLASRQIPIPENWALGTTAMQAVGFMALALVATWLAWSVFANKRSWSVRGHVLELPPARLAVLQILVGTLNWATMALVMYLLLQRAVDYPTVLGVLLLAAVAGALTHVPAGLGVLETVFILCLGETLPHTEILAALLVYRALYYLAPLSLAVPAYLLMEARARKRQSSSKAT